MSLLCRIRGYRQRKEEEEEKKGGKRRKKENEKFPSRIRFDFFFFFFGIQGRESFLSWTRFFKAIFILQFVKQLSCKIWIKSVEEGHDRKLRSDWPIPACIPATRLQTVYLSSAPSTNPSIIVFFLFFFYHFVSPLPHFHLFISSPSSPRHVRLPIPLKTPSLRADVRAIALPTRFLTHAGADADADGSRTRTGGPGFPAPYPGAGGGGVGGSPGQPQM